MTWFGDEEANIYYVGQSVVLRGQRETLTARGGEERAFGYKLIFEDSVPPK